MSKRNVFIVFAIGFFLFDFVAVGVPIGSLVFLIAAFNKRLASYVGHKLVEHSESQ